MLSFNIFYFNWSNALLCVLSVMFLMVGLGNCTLRMIGFTEMEIVQSVGLLISSINPSSSHL